MTRRINLALQGGGAHGAFTWGVLDRLLAEEDLEIAAISGTSAGAINAAALKAGMIAGGREGARENLDWLWTQFGAWEEGLWHAVAPFWPGASMISSAIHGSPFFQISEALGQVSSPYFREPILGNPLESVVSQLREDDIRATTGPKLFINATNVRTGKIRVFEGDEVSHQAILASACLPNVFRAVEVDDPKTGRTEAYWDGGFSGNPALFPLFNKDLPDDIVIVNINPLSRDAIPMAPHDIQNRINEISFNSALLRELRAISFVKRLISEGQVGAGDMKDVNVHMIADDALMNDLSVATKLVPNPLVLGELKDAGQKVADSWIKLHKDQINRECSVDLIEMFS